MSASQFEKSLAPGGLHYGLAQFAGRWRGVTRTYFEPGKLADESETEAEFETMLGGRFLRYSYTGSLQGEPLEGRAAIGYSFVEKRFEVAWIDSFHTGTALLFSIGGGSADASRFSVLGSYSDPSGGPPWGWRTEFELKSDTELLVNAYNITPDGEEALAVETILERVG